MTEKFKSIKHVADDHVILKQSTLTVQLTICTIAFT